MKKLIILISMLILAKYTYGQKTIWIEAEHFKNPGGWINDFQFIDQMGSPYLMANGLGTPADDAITTVKIPEAGRYRMWVRTKDWCPEYHPGRFEVLLQGKKSDKTFGESGEKGWLWEDGGVFEISGNITLALHDLTGYYGRCDAIVLTSDLGWIPPEDKGKINELRKKYGGISQDIKNIGSFDVIVVGGGVAGTLAAVSAARQGAKTVLIENSRELGGNASSENLVPPVGVQQTLLSAEDRKIDPRETGIIEEISTYGNQRYFIDGKLWPGRLKRLAEAEPNLSLFLNTEATGVEMKDKSEISGVICIDLISSQRIRFKGKIFIDCTGNGIIGIKAGAKYMTGRESKSMYNETRAPETPDSTTLPSSLKYWYLPQAEPQHFETPEWIYSLPSECSDFEPEKHPRLGALDQQWTIELGGTSRTYEDAEEVRDNLFRLIYGLWDHVKNHCTHPANVNAKNMKLVWVGHVVGLRESYRLTGDYVMSEKDVTEQPLPEDRIAYGGWGLDDHPSAGFFETFIRELYHTHPGLLFSIPYRSIYSRNIDNLMMAGRDISVTHLALTATRVMLTTGVIGHAAGTAAGMCIRKKTTPRGIYQDHIKELQQLLLKEGSYLIELQNTDEKDLALKAKASASSEISPASEAINGFSRARLPTSYANAEKKINAWIPDPDANGPRWLQLSWDQPQRFNVVHITFQNRGELAYAKVGIEVLDGTHWENLVEIDNSKKFRRLVIPLDNIKTRSLRIVLKDDDTSGGIAEVRVYYESQHTIESIRRINKTMSLSDEEVLLPWEF